MIWNCSSNTSALNTEVTKETKLTCSQWRTNTHWISTCTETTSGFVTCCRVHVTRKFLHTLFSISGNYKKKKLIKTKWKPPWSLLVKKGPSCSYEERQINSKARQTLTRRDNKRAPDTLQWVWIGAQNISVQVETRFEKKNGNVTKTTIS